MHNRFWWQRTARGIMLSHLRYEQPVMLFELLPRGTGTGSRPSLIGAGRITTAPS